MGLFSFLFNASSQTSIPPVENISLNRLIPKMKEWKIDTVFVTTSNRCPVCKIYERKIYSFYGWNRKYSKLPEFLYQNKCPTCNCSIGVSMFFPGINSKPK